MKFGTNKEKGNSGLGMAIAYFSANGYTVSIPLNDTQDYRNDTQGIIVPSKNELDAWIEEQIKRNPKITTEKLASMSKRSIITIKRHIAKLDHISFVGSGFSGHWEFQEIS